MSFEDGLSLEERDAILRGCGLKPSRVSVQRLERDEPVRNGTRSWWYLLTDLGTGIASGTSCLSGRPPRAELRYSAAQLAQYLKRARTMHQEVIPVFNALSKLIPNDADTLLLTLARDGERWRVNVVPQLADAQLAEASTPLTLVSSLEELETGFVDALERFSGATLPLMAQVEAAIAASQAAVEAAKQKAASKAETKPSSTAKPPSPAKVTLKAEPTKQAEPASSGGLFDAPSSEADEPASSETSEPVADEAALRLADLQTRLKQELDGLTSEKEALALKLNAAASAAFELESAFVSGSEELEPPMRAIPLGKRFLEIASRIRVLEDRGVEALEEAA